MQVMDFQAETLLLNSAQLKSTLNLNANQQKLWQQVEGKVNAILRQRQIRREHLKTTVEDALAKPALELRDLNPRIEAEEQQSLEENKQIREQFLTFNDALDDQQRNQIQSFLLEQLQSQTTGRKAPTDNNDSKPRQGGHSRGSMGGGMGGGAGNGIKF